MLGLCARAGKLAYGADAAADAVRKGRAGVVVMDEGAGPNTRKMLKNACLSHGARNRIQFDRYEKSETERTISGAIADFDL